MEPKIDFATLYIQNKHIKIKMAILLSDTLTIADS